MPRVQVHLPEDLHIELKRRGLPASELLQIAVRAELERQDARSDTDTVTEVLENSLAYQEWMDMQATPALTIEDAMPTIMAAYLHGDPRGDANTHHFLKMCIIETSVSRKIARRAAELRRLGKTGSAVDALIAAIA